MSERSSKRGPRAQLTRQQRLRTVGELAIGIGHDVNNLLGALELRLRGVLLGRDEVLEPGDREAVRSLLANGRVLADKLQDLGSAQRLRRETIDVVDVARGALDLADSGLRLSAAELRTCLRFELDVPRDLPAVVGDRQELLHALVSLLVSARDAVVRRRRARSAITTIRIEASVGGRDVELRVADSDGPSGARFVMRLPRADRQRAATTTRAAIPG